jgi:hypothetical protein
MPGQVRRHIRNAGAPRYAVGADIWEAGIDFDAWVETAFADELEDTVD